MERATVDGLAYFQQLPRRHIKLDRRRLFKEGSLKLKDLRI
jgi:hypothetical protein